MPGLISSDKKPSPETFAVDSGLGIPPDESSSPHRNPKEIMFCFRSVNKETNVEGEEEGEEVGVEEEEIDPKQVMDCTAKGYPLNKDNYSRFATFIGDVAREKIPITHENWRNFFKDHPELAKSIWKHIKVNLLFKISTQNECMKND